VWRWRAPLAVVMYQAAPVGMQADEQGRFRLAVGYGGESYMQQAFSCEGALLDERRIRSSVVSGMADFAIGENTRVWGFAGNASASVGGCRGGCYFDGPFDGSFGGAGLVGEHPKIGLGLGLVVMPRPTPPDNPHAPTSHKVLPTARVRLGNADGVHARFELLNVQTPGQVPIGVIGAGFGDQSGSRLSGFAGLGLGPHRNVGSGIAEVATLNFEVGLTQRLDLMAGGMIGDGEFTSINAGLRMHFLRR
jgi:hypothetical protein